MLKINERLQSIGDEIPLARQSYADKICNYHTALNTRWPANIVLLVARSCVRHPPDMSEIHFSCFSKIDLPALSDEELNYCKLY